MSKHVELVNERETRKEALEANWHKNDAPESLKKALRNAEAQKRRLKMRVVK